LTQRIFYDPTLQGIWIIGYGGVKLSGMKAGTPAAPAATVDNFLSCSGNLIDCNLKTLRNLGDPFLPKDATTKEYVDGAVTGGFYTNASNLITGTVNKDRLPSLYNSISMNDVPIRFRNDDNYVIRYKTDTSNTWLDIYGSTGISINGGGGTGFYLWLFNNLIDCNNKRIVNVGTPINPNDAANKTYVDTPINFLSYTKSPEFIRYNDYKYILDKYVPVFWLSGYYSDGLRAHNQEAIYNPHVINSSGIVDLTGRALGTGSTGAFLYSSGSIPDSARFRLDGTNKFNSNITFTDYYTFFVIGSKDAGAVGRLFTSTSGNRLLGWWDNFMRCNWASANIYGLGSNQTTNDGSEKLYIARSTGSSKDFYENSSQYAFGVSNTDSWGNVSVGGNLESTTGYIYEVICFNKSLLDGHLNIVRNFLKKYYTFIT
jgi:hypothetical protein